MTGKTEPKPNIIHETIDSPYSMRLKRPGPGSSALHWHRRAEILCVVKGACSLTIGDRTYLCRPGDVAVIQSGEIHAFTHAEPSEEYVCTFDPTHLYHFQPEIRVPEPYISAERLAAAGIREEVRGLLDEIYREREGAEAMRDVVIVGDILRLYGPLVRHFERETPPERKDAARFRQFQETLQLIAEHYTEKITLQEIADFLHYTPAYVSTLFVTHTGVNFKSYLDTMRIDRAIREIQISGRSISEIALSCGFENIRTFNSTFKRVTGVSPSRIKNNSL